MAVSDRPRVAGLIIGLVLGVLSWIGNASRTNLGIAAAFPDVMTVAAVPLALYFFVRARARAAPAPPCAPRRLLYDPGLLGPATLPSGAFLASTTSRKARLREAHPKERLRMATGTVKWFNATKGYGFIVPQDGGKDVFVNITAVQAAGLNGLNDGQRVSYEVQMERGKAAATNLRLL